MCSNVVGRSQHNYTLSIPLTARLMSISSKSLWSSMAATSQRYSAVSDRVALKIRMLAGSLSWALFSKSPFHREGEEKNTLQLLIQTHTMTSQFKNRFHAKFFQGAIYSAKQQFLRHCYEMLWCSGFSKRETFQELYLLSCFESRHNWGHHF